MSGRGRRGLALVELVSGTGMVLLLVALQLPALNKAREAARRAQCVNNLKQIALATHNYVATDDVFPMSAVVGPGHGNGHGCFAQILPYMEQAAVYNAYNFWLENWHAANRTAVGVKLAVVPLPVEHDGGADGRGRTSGRTGRDLRGQVGVRRGALRRELGRRARGVGDRPGDDVSRPEASRPRTSA